MENILPYDDQINENFSDIDIDEELKGIDLDNIELDPEIQELLNNTQRNDTWNNYEQRHERNTVIIKPEEQSLDPFFPNNNVPEEWKWTELEECILDLEGSELIKKMQEIRGKRREDTNITELATLCMTIQRTKVEREQKIATGKWEQNVKMLQEKLHKTEQDMRIVKREKEDALKILKSLRKMMTATQLELTKLEKIHKENKIITQIWKDLNEDKERELELQKEYIKRLENEKQ
jgi:hypothetical protein